MRIKKLQGGGFASFTPIVPTMPVNPVRPTEKSDSTESTSLIDKDVYKKLIEAGGLVNDVNNFVEQVQELESDTSPYLSSSRKSSAIMLIGKVNELIQSRKYWEESLGNAKASGGLGEIAVDGNRRIYVRDEDNNIKAISLADYKKQEQKLSALTVADLLTARQYDKNLVGNNTIFGIANESVGIEKITNHIQDMMSLLSEASMSSEKHYSKQQILDNIKQLTGKTPTEADLQAIKELAEIANTPGDFYKVISESSSKRQGAGRALRYIWSTLDSASQNKLEAVAAVNGMNDPTELIKDMLFTYTEPKTSTKIIPESQSDIYGTEKEENKKPLTVMQLIHKDKLATPNSTFAFNDPKLGILFRGAIGGVSPVITPDGTPVGMQTLYNVFNNPKIGYGIFLDQAKALLGETKLSDKDLTNIIYDGKDAAKVYMPVDASGNPDYKMFARFKEIYAEYERSKANWTAEQASDFFKENGFNLAVEESFDGTKREKIIRDNNLVKPFYALYGYTNDATDLVDNNNSMFISRLSEDEEDEILPFLKQIWTVGTGKSAKDLTPDGWGGEDYYKVMVTVPYRVGYAALIDGMVGQGPKEAGVSMEQVSANLRGSQQKATNTKSSEVLN